MTELWLAAAHRVTPTSPGGAMDGTAPKACVWHTTEGPSIASAVTALLTKRAESHIVWDPAKGDFVQLLPANVSARSLQNDFDLRTNRVGTIRVQIEVVGYAAHPFTTGPMIGRSMLLAWLDQLGIPHAWPFGPLLPYPKSYGTKNGTRSRTTYLSKSGHMGHSNVPGNDHGDPGAIDQAKLVPPVRPPTPEPPEDEDMVPPILTTNGGKVWYVAPYFTSRVEVPDAGTQAFLESKGAVRTGLTDKQVALIPIAAP